MGLLEVQKGQFGLLTFPKGVYNPGQPTARWATPPTVKFQYSPISQEKANWLLHPSEWRQRCSVAFGYQSPSIAGSTQASLDPCSIYLSSHQVFSHRFPHLVSMTHVPLLATSLTQGWAILSGFGESNDVAGVGRRRHGLPSVVFHAIMQLARLYRANRMLALYINEEIHTSRFVQQDCHLGRQQQS